MPVVAIRGQTQMIADTQGIGDQHRYHFVAKTVVVVRPLGSH